MKTKPLYILITNCGDGSFYPQFTFDPKLIEELEKAADEDRMDYETGIGCDGDGFHYETLQVPIECTEESLDIRCLPSDFAEQFK